MTVLSIYHEVACSRPSGGDDRVAVFRRAEDAAIVVADGAGGTGSGSRAAEAAIEHVRRRWDTGAALDAWAVVADADAAIVATANGGQTTVVLVAVTAEGVAGASVGDSEAWIVRANDVVKLTDRQQRKPLLGTGDAHTVPFGAARLDGTLVIGTDGLFKYTTMAKILDAVRSTEKLDSLPGRLVDLVRLRSGSLQDDVAVVVCRAAP